MDIIELIKLGVANIGAHNGWAMAFLGICIVFSGLVLLSIVISQLHKILLYLDKKSDQKENSDSDDPGKPIILPDVFPDDINEIKALYRPLFDKLGTPFQLSDLYRMTEKNSYPHPHLTISLFRQEGVLIASGNGEFYVNE